MDQITPLAKRVGPMQVMKTGLGLSAPVETSTGVRGFMMR